MNPPARSRSTGRVTLNDVAAVAQVSTITASRVLRGLPNVSADLASRVRAAAERLGYVPDPAARALASAHGTQVLLLVPALADPLLAAAAEAAERALRPAGLQTLLACSGGEPAQALRLLREALPHRPAGLIVAGLEPGGEAEGAATQGKAPCVLLGALSDDPALACVGVDDEAAGHALARHLLERDRKRIAFVGAGSGVALRRRTEGWRRALHDAGLYDARREVHDPRPPSLPLGAELFAELHERQRANDAVVFSDDRLAQGALLAALRLHLRVPQQVAIAGFGDLEGAEQMPAPLTTVRLPGAALGAEAARLLLAMLQGGPPARVDLGFELVVRASS